MKKDYMVSYEAIKGYPNELICGTLKEARKEAKRLSKNFGWARIQMWYEEGGDWVISESFEINYEKGVEEK